MRCISAGRSLRSYCRFARWFPELQGLRRASGVGSKDAVRFSYYFTPLPCFLIAAARRSERAIAAFQRSLFFILPMPICRIEPLCVVWVVELCCEWVVVCAPLGTTPQPSAATSSKSRVSIFDVRVVIIILLAEALQRMTCGETDDVGLVVPGKESG